MHFSWAMATFVKTKTATRSCRTQKREFYFYSPGVVRRSHAVAQHVRTHPATAAAAAAAALLCIGNLMIKINY